MSCNGREQLTWVQRNREGRISVASLGGLVAAWVDTSLDGGSRQAQQLASELAAIVDGEFRMHARVHVDESRRIVIAVDRPELVYVVRMRWGDRIRRAARMISGLSQSPVLFVCGEWGVRIPVPQGD